MASETYIITQEKVNIPSGIDYAFGYGLFQFRFYIDLDEMEDLLDVCKVTPNINDIDLSCLTPILSLVKQLGIKNYLIEYIHDFAGMPEGNGFIIPVSNGKIFCQDIVDFENDSRASHKRVYELIGVDDPYN